MKTGSLLNLETRGLDCVEKRLSTLVNLGFDLDPTERLINDWPSLLSMVKGLEENERLKKLLARFGNFLFQILIV